MHFVDHGQNVLVTIYVYRQVCKSTHIRNASDKVDKHAAAKPNQLLMQKTLSYVEFTCQLYGDVVDDKLVNISVQRSDGGAGIHRSTGERCTTGFHGLSAEIESRREPGCIDRQSAAVFAR